MPRGARKAVKIYESDYYPIEEGGKSIEQMAVDRLKKYFGGTSYRVALRRDHRGKEHVEIYERQSFPHAQKNTVALVYYNTRGGFLCNFKTKDPKKQIDVHLGIASLILVT